MTRRGAAVAAPAAPAAAALAALSTVLLLAGCSITRQPPPLLDDVEVRAYAQRVLDTTWADLDLPPGTARPAAAATLERDPGLVSASMESCMIAAGISNYGWSIYEDRLYLSNYEGARDSDPTRNLAFYACVAQHPLATIDPAAVLSEAQRAYLYDYYAEWLVPCLDSLGYPSQLAPTREQYLGQQDAYGWWDPYYSARSVQTVDEYTSLVERCGQAGPDAFVPASVP